MSKFYQGLQDKERSALDRQVGGDHYKDFKIQPAEFITKNRIEFLPGCIIKRACRFDKPGGKWIQDLKKIKHEVDLLIELLGYGVPKEVEHDDKVTVSNDDDSIDLSGELRLDFADWLKNRDSISVIDLINFLRSVRERQELTEDEVV